MKSVLLALCVLAVSALLASESRAGVFARFRGGNCNSGCSTSSTGNGCNISSAAPQQASAAALAQQIINETAGTGVSALGIGENSHPRSLKPEPQAIVLDRKAAITFCALPRDPLVIGRMASK